MEMEWVRVTRSVYGQTELSGASWDPLLLFVLAGIAIVVLHALYKMTLAPRAKASDSS
jgi:hypothetical protein